MRRAEVTKIRSDYIASKEVYEKVKKKRRKGLYRRLVAYGLFLALSIGGMTSVIASQSDQLQEEQNKKQQLEKQLAKAKDKQEALKREIELLHDDEYIGKIARRDYYMSKEGEIIFAKPEADKH